jgi:hypothetical protein
LLFGVGKWLEPRGQWGALFLAGVHAGQVIRARCAAFATAGRYEATATAAA